MILKGFREFINESESNATYQDLKLLLELGIAEDITDDVIRLLDQGKLNHAELLDWTKSICDKYKIKDWTLNSEGLVDVNGSVELDNIKLTRLPLRFGRVSGNFWCHNNQLTTLEGAPQWVGGDFDCTWNELTILKWAPQKVGGDFMCSRNYLTTLDGAPKEVRGDFSCSSNRLTSLKGAPNLIGGSFYCNRNPLTSLEGIGEVKGKFYSDIK